MYFASNELNSATINIILIYRSECVYCGLNDLTVVEETLFL